MFSPEEYLAGKFLLIDKPLTWTSHDVINKIRYRLTRYCGVKKLKVGHAGTLDPLATGLLIIATGGFTKKLDTIIASEKEYTGTFFIGACTASYDAETPVEKKFSITHISETFIHETAKKFTGKQKQFPPAHSAVKIEGKPLYVHARKGIEMHTEARDFEIYAFEITGIALPYIHFRIHCSKGTYIRSIANDFGLALQSGAYLSALRRTKVGEYSIENAQTLETFLHSISSGS